MTLNHKVLIRMPTQGQELWEEKNWDLLWQLETVENCLIYIGRREWLPYITALFLFLIQILKPFQQSCCKLLSHISWPETCWLERPHAEHDLIYLLCGVPGWLRLTCLKEHNISPHMSWMVRMHNRRLSSGRPHEPGGPALRRVSRNYWAKTLGLWGEQKTPVVLGSMAEFFCHIGIYGWVYSECKFNISHILGLKAVVNYWN